MSYKVGFLLKKMHFRFWQLSIVVCVLSIGSACFAIEEDSGLTAKSDSYRVQPGDLLDIKVFREADLTGAYQVDPKGELSFPLVGRISVQGSSLSELREQVTQGLRKYLVNPQVTISRTESTIKSISVLGHVKNAGRYDYSPGSSLMRVISEAGGFTPSANRKKIRIVRVEDGKKTSIIVNAVDIIDGKSDDRELEAGDMIFVPESIF